METFGAAVDGKDDDFLDQQPADQGDDDFMSDGDDFLHQQPGQGEEGYIMSDDDDDDYRTAQGDHDDDDFMSDDEDDEEYHPFPVHAPPAAAAVAALEAAEAPADDCCPVCLQDDDGDGEAPAKPPAARPWNRVAPCGHRFHAAYVGRWMRVKLSCPVCRCLAATAPEPPPPRRRPVTDIVEEMLAMGYEESLGFKKSPRWTEFMANAYGHLTSNSSRVSLAVAA